MKARSVTLNRRIPRERRRNKMLRSTNVVRHKCIDVEGVSHVVNFELPDVPEAYVHRIGRTARAGATGRAISLCDNGERLQIFFS